MKVYLKQFRKALNFSLQLVLKSILIFTLASCGTNNIFKSYSKQDSDEALIEDAKKLIDGGDYAGAVTKLNSVSADFIAASSENKVSFYETRAAAYAGKCGLIFVTFTSGFSGSGSFIAKARNAFLGKTVDAPSCALAQADMEALGTNAQRSSNANFFMAILGLAKLGTVLKASSDADSDGVADSSWSACNVDPYLSDSDVKSAFTGIGLLLDNLTAIGTSVSGLDSSAITTFSDSCKTLLNVPSCSFTQTSDIDATMTLGFRKILDSPTDGIGQCTNEVGGVCCSTDL